MATNERRLILFLALILSAVSVIFFTYFYQTGLGLSYNDARSHLDIGRRVVEGLKPGLAQIGSVWLPLNHLLMVPTIWNDFMWHSGLAGAIQSMISYVATSLLIYLLLKELKVGMLGRVFGVVIFATNLNILYLQSTAMTELLLLATMTAGVYYFVRWAHRENIASLVNSAFWVLMSTLLRYDGWFLLGFVLFFLIIIAAKKHGIKAAEGMAIMFTTLAAIGIIGWFLWNQLIFKDALYFILGPFSAHAQQQVLKNAGNLPTIGNPLLSLKVYLYALFYNSNVMVTLMAFLGAILLWLDKSIKWEQRLAAVALTAPFFFNVLALILGFSVVHIQGISGTSWFNVRYGVMLAPSIAVYVGYLFDRAKNFRALVLGLVVFISFFAWANFDAVTMDDAKFGASQKNVSEVSGYLKKYAGSKPGFILVSAASHDAVIFSSGLPMKRFIHEGTGQYWQQAVAAPDQWARWIVMRTYDPSDMTYREIQNTPGFANYHLVAKYPFADVYEINSDYLNQLHYFADLGKQK